MDEQLRIQAFTTISSGWLASGIQYGIINGYGENSPGVGRDLDISIGNAHIPRALEIATRILRDCGWEYRLDGREWAWWIFAFFRVGDHVVGLEIDLVPRLQSGINCLQQGVSIFTCPVGELGWNVDPRGSLIKRVVLQLIAGNFSKFDHNPGLLELSPLERHVLKSDSGIRELLSGTFLAGESGFPPADLRPLKPLLKRRLYAKALLRPNKALEAGLFGLARSIRLNLFARQVCPVLSITAEAGIDNTEVIEFLSEKLQQATFLRPMVLNRDSTRPSHNPRPSTQDQSDTGWDQRKEMTAPPPNGLRLPGLLIRHWLEEKFIANRKSVRLYPVIYANHPIHLLMDPESHGIASIPGWLPKCMPKASLSFALTGESDQEPKHEDPRHCSLDQLKRMGLIDEVVSMKEGPEQAAARIFERVLEQFLKPAQPIQSAR